MRVRVVLGSLLLSVAVAGGGWLLAKGGRDRPALEADGDEADRGPLERPGDTLAAPVRREAAASETASARGRIEGEVRRAGVGVPARVLLYEVHRIERGAEPGYRPNRTASRVPLEETLDAAPVLGVDADATGRFVLADVPAGRYEVVARSPEGAAGATWATVACERARVVVRIELRGGGPARLSGRVRHADGRPFRGFVAAGRDGAVFFPHAATAVAPDEEGRFVLAGLDAGALCVFAYAPGAFFARSHVVVVPGAGELDFVVDGAFADTAGRVVADEDGRPVAGAVVLASANQGAGAGVAVAQARAVTDADGRFRMPAPRGRADYRVEAPGFAPLDAHRGRVEGEALEFRLARGGRVTGRVTSKADGAPVEGVTVYVVDGRGASGPLARTKSDGRYEVSGLAPGDVVVVACGGGWLSDGFSRATERFNPFALPLAAGETATVDLVVTRGARATGVVLDAAGTPAAGARVRARRRAPGGESDDAVFGFLAEAQGVASGPDGRFLVESLAAGASYEFDATSPDTSPGRAGPVRADLEKPVEVELRLGAARVGEVVVRESGGGPVAGLLVYANASGGDARTRAYTGADGVARLSSLPPGPIDVGTWSDDAFHGDSVTAGGPEGSTDPVHAELVVERRFAIAGVVRYADGGPFDGQEVTLRSADGAEQALWLGREGAFRFTGVTAGAYDLEVRRDWGGDPVLTATARTGDENLVLVVDAPRPERLVVTVLDADGRPVGRGTYRLACDGGGDDGSFEDGRVETGVRAAEWSILVHGVRTPNGGPAPGGATIAGPFPATARAQEVRLPPERRIEGVVRAPDGHGVRGVRVAASFVGLPAPFADVDAEVASARTDDKGRFRLGGLGDGRYRLRVAVGGGFGAIEPVEYEAGRLDVVLTLKVGDAVAPVVLDADLAPVAGAFLRASCEGTDSIAESDGEGRVALEGLDASRTYRLEVRVPSARADVLGTVLEEWTPSSEPIVLARGFVVAGIVRDPEGRPVADAEIEASVAHGDRLETRSRGNGRFELRRVPEGPVTLTATADGERSLRSRPFATAAGVTDTVVVLEATTRLVVRLTAERPLPEGANVHICRADGSGDSSWESPGDDGKVVFTDLLPSVLYAVSADVETSGGAHLVGIVKEVRGDAGTLALALVEGRTVSGRVRLAPGVTDVRVWAITQGEVRGGELDEAGRFTIRGLFEGPCVVSARGDLPGGGHAVASADTSAGATIELDLAPER